MKRASLFTFATLCCLALFTCRVVRADDTPATGGSTDVTKLVQQAVTGNSLSLPVNNDLGGDPAPTLKKKLKVEYTINGTAEAKVVFEGSVLEVRAPKGAKLAVTKATYGDLKDEQKVDVTRVLADAVQGDKLNMGVNNETLGGDPAPTTVKKLEVDYTVGGKAGKASVGEFDTLDLPAPGEGAGKLVIVHAIYGAL